MPDCPDCATALKEPFTSCPCGWDNKLLLTPIKRWQPQPEVIQTPEEWRYAIFRIRTLNRALSSHQFAAVMAHALMLWLRVKPLRAWATQQTVPSCQQHADAHSLLDCLAEETEWWKQKADTAIVDDRARATRRASLRAIFEKARISLK